MSKEKEASQKQDGGPDPQKLQQSIAASQKVVAAQNAAEGFKAKAAIAMDPIKRKEYLQQAYQKEVEAHGESKFAKRLQSGPWQGAGAGAGIGGAISAGLGTTVGTLVTGVAAVPTVLVGGLTGAAVGGIHGPWITLGGGKKGEKKPSAEEQHAQAMQEAEKLDSAVEKSASTVPQPPDLEDAGSSSLAESPARRKPKKLEVRSGKETPQQTEKRRPRKLQTRSSPATAA